jgi:hypothetical protein
VYFKNRKAKVLSEGCLNEKNRKLLQLLELIMSIGQKLMAEHKRIENQDLNIHTYTYKGKSIDVKAVSEIGVRVKTTWYQLSPITTQWLPLPL